MLLSPRFLTVAALLAAIGNAFFFISAGAQTEPSKRSDSGPGPAEEVKELSISTPVFTKESIVEINGSKFRKVEYGNRVVFLQLLNEEGSGGDLQILCGNDPRLNSKRPQQVLAAVRVTKRSSLFVDGLKKICVKEAHGDRVVLDPALRVGFLIHDTDQDRSLLKNKKFFVTPGVSGLGFAAEW